MLRDLEGRRRLLLLGCDLPVNEQWRQAAGLGCCLAPSNVTVSSGPLENRSSYDKNKESY